MSQYYPAVRASDIPAGSMKSVAVAGKQIAIANVDGTYFAVDDTCTHAGCSLGGEGFLEGSTITCGCHGAQFDVTSGNVLALPAVNGITCYQVKVEGDNVMVLL